MNKTMKKPYKYIKMNQKITYFNKKSQIFLFLLMIKMIKIQ